MKKLFAFLLFISTISLIAQQKQLSLEEAILPSKHGLSPKTLSGLQWLESTNHYVYEEDNSFVIKPAAGKKEIAKITLEQLQKVYPDMEGLPSVMHFSLTELVFESKSAIVHFDYIKNKETTKIAFVEKATNQDYCLKNKSVAYTIDNNLYVANSTQEKLPVTNIADKNIVSGQAIHRYEFGIMKGTFWSPNGNYLAFYQKDETNVSDYPLVDITTYPAKLDNIKYPMAGQASEQAKIGIYNTKTQQISYLDINTSDEHYLTNLSWSPDEKYVFVAEVNRAQDHMWFNQYDVVIGKKIKTLFEEQSDKWVEPEHDAVFLPNSATDFLWMSERDGYMNLYHYTTEGKLVKQVTPYQFVVKSILGFDPKGTNVFVEATGEDPRNTKVFSVNLETGRSTHMTEKNGTHYCQLSKDGAYLIDNYSSLETPREIAIIDTKTAKATMLLKAENPLKDYEIGETELSTINYKDSLTFYAREIRPADFDEKKKYPVLIYVYGGTHAQMVTNDWLGGARLWMHWLANEKGYIVFTLDNRGSENRGFDFESVIHREAGEAAMKDQLMGVDYLKSLPYVDANRISVHGWSYGGFMASSLMLRHPGVFKAAVAGGPVTDWKYYEVMYGERYMDTPQENPEGYKNSRVGNYLENLQGKLMLVHGSVDPTVVPQHSMTLLKEAVDKNVQLDFFTYPMHPHNVRGKDRVHLMQKVLDYIVEYNK